MKRYTKAERLILNKYYSVRYPGSFSSIRTFKKALEEVDGIHISYGKLRKLLMSQEYYAQSIIKKSKFIRRHVICDAPQVSFEADIGFISNSRDGSRIIFLLCVDQFSKKIFISVLPNTQTSEIRKAFCRLFDQKHFPFSILRCDLEPSFLKLRPFFARNHVLLAPKRGKKAAIAEASIKKVKRKVIIKLRMNPDANVAILLRQAANSLNNTPLAKTQLSPNEQTNPLMQAYIRKKLFGTEKIRPFPAFFQEQQKRRKFFETRDSKSEKSRLNFDHTSFKLGELVYLDFSPRWFHKVYR